MTETIGKSIARLETKVDLLLELSKGTEDRIRDLEKTRNWMKGALAVIGVAWAFALKALLGDK